jgi:AraC family transcriptional regulator
MTEQFANLTQFYNEGPFGNRTQEHRTIGSPPISLSKVDFPAHDTCEPATGSFVICLALRGTVNASFRFDERWREEVLRPGMFAPIAPPHTVGEWRMDAPHQHLVISLPERALECASEGSHRPQGCDLGWLHDRGFRDAFLYQLCLTLWDEARQSNPLGPIFGDCAQLALAAGLLRRSGMRGKSERASRKLQAQELRRIDAYIDERIDQSISLREVAELVGLSQQNFARALKVSCGRSPHQHVIARRLDMAKRLLLDPARSMAEVATTVGFSDQAHMTVTFSRLLGYTPGQWRKDRLT